MTVFNPENKQMLSYGECLIPAMGITNQEDANQYKKDYIAYTERCLEENPENKTDKTAEEIVNINLGYFAGYYSDEVRKRVEKLFNCSHPIFGKCKR